MYFYEERSDEVEVLLGLDGKFEVPPLGLLVFPVFLRVVLDIEGDISDEEDGPQSNRFPAG